MANKGNKKTNPQPAKQQHNVAATQTESKKTFTVSTKLVFLLGIISFLVYANTLGNGYAVDDGSAITDNTIVTRGVSAIPELLYTPYRKGINLASNDLYRPLSLVMFAVEYQFFGLNPVPGHFMNVLVFCGCVILLFLFLDLLFERKKTAVAFVAALLFALHPIHTEVVANIKSRDELLCFFFAFLSLYLFIKYIQSKRIILLMEGMLCFFLSILAKETAYTFLAIVPMVFFFLPQREQEG